MGEYVVMKVYQSALNENEELREQNRVLASALENVLNAWVNGRKVRDGIPLEVLEAALTATSQPAPPYKEWCRHPEECAGLASCPRNPTCAD